MQAVSINIQNVAVCETAVPCDLIPGFVWPWSIQLVKEASLKTLTKENEGSVYKHPKRTACETAVPCDLNPGFVWPRSIEEFQCFGSPS